MELPGDPHSNKCSRYHQGLTMPGSRGATLRLNCSPEASPGAVSEAWQTTWIRTSPSVPQPPLCLSRQPVSSVHCVSVCLLLAPTLPHLTALWEQEEIKRSSLTF